MGKVNILLLKQNRKRKHELDILSCIGDAQGLMAHEC